MLPFVPTVPMQVAVEICSIPPDVHLPKDLERKLVLSLNYRPDSWAKSARQ